MSASQLELLSRQTHSSCTSMIRRDDKVRISAAYPHTYPQVKVFADIGPTKCCSMRHT